MVANETIKISRKMNRSTVRVRNNQPVLHTEGALEESQTEQTELDRVNRSVLNRSVGLFESI